MTMMLYTFNKLINAVLSANETESAYYNMLSYNDLWLRAPVSFNCTVPIECLCRTLDLDELG